MKSTIYLLSVVAVTVLAGLGHSTAFAGPIGTSFDQVMEPPAFQDLLNDDSARETRDCLAATCADMFMDLDGRFAINPLLVQSIDLELVNGGDDEFLPNIGQIRQSCIPVAGSANDGCTNDQAAVSVPEPGTLWLLLSGLLPVAARRAVRRGA